MNKTIGFNMIVGAGEADYLKRILSVIHRISFDQVVITVTAEDLEVMEVVQRYATDIEKFEWVDDFSAARNHCIKKTATDYIFWLDADDVIPMTAVDGWNQIINQIVRVGNFDYYVVPEYFLAYSDDGKPKEKGERVTIFKNNGKILFNYPIHECPEVTPEMSFGTLKGAFIEHRPEEEKNSGERNRKILKKYLDEKYDGRMAFYYGMELIGDMQFEEGLKSLKEGICDHKFGPMYGAQACMVIAMVELYGDGKGLRLRKTGIHVAENYCNIGLSMCGSYAEMYVMLGDIFDHRGDTANAIKCYQGATLCKLDAPLSQNIEYHEYIPSSRLASLFVRKGDYERALLYNRKVLDVRVDEREIGNRKKILGELNQQFSAV